MAASDGELTVGGIGFRDVVVRKYEQRPVGGSDDIFRKASTALGLAIALESVHDMLTAALTSPGLDPEDLTPIEGGRFLQEQAYEAEYRQGIVLAYLVDVQTHRVDTPRGSLAAVHLGIEDLIFALVRSISWTNQLQLADVMGLVDPVEIEEARKELRSGMAAQLDAGRRLEQLLTPLRRDDGDRWGAFDDEVRATIAIAKQTSWRDPRLHSDSYRSMR